MGYVLGMRCRECGAEYEKQPSHVCELCFGPLEVAYDWDTIKKKIESAVERDEITRREADAIFSKLKQ